MLRARTAWLAILAVGVASEFVVGLVPLSSTPRRVDVDAIAAQAVAVDINSPYTPGAYSFLARAVSTRPDKRSASAPATRRPKSVIL